MTARIAEDEREALAKAEIEGAAIQRELVAKQAREEYQKQQAEQRRAQIEVPVQVVAQLYFDDDGAWSCAEFLFNGGCSTVRIGTGDRWTLQAETPGAALDLALQLAAQKRLRGDMW